MDSGNSGSLQSSSGGEEEYDSRGETSISSFLNSSAHFASISDPQSQLLSHHHQPTLFNPSHSHNFDTFPQSLGSSSGNSQFGNDLVWSRGLRSEPNYGNFGNLTGSSSSSQSVLGTQGLSHQVPFTSSSSSSMPSQLSAEGNAAPRTSSQQSDQPNIVKNPKKRTRASRRAPTTVLTTDTTNFRQMVQEFTGIPTAPFSGSPYSRRLDLFSTGSSLRSGHLDSLGPLYPLRPSAQKVQLPFFPPSSSSSPSLLNSSVMDALASTSTNNPGSGTNNPNNNSNNTAAGTSNAIATNTNHDQYQITSNLGLPKQPQDLLNMQNQMLAFQPLLESSLHLSSLKHPTSVLATKSQGISSASHVPSFDDLGLSHENVNTNLGGGGGFPSHGSSGAAQRWRGDQEQLGSSSQRINYKFNCSASTSEFHPDKGLENVSSAGEGTVGSWICPSD